MTKKDLQELYWVKRGIKQLENKLIELESSASRITTRISKEPKSGQSFEDKLSEVVAKIVDLENEINEKVKESYDLMGKIEKAIENLPPREAYLIRARYIDLKSWESICVDMNYSWRQIHYIHSDALKYLA
jgi:DNA-directed RNA polymerase specialized sigma subunit